MDRRNFIKIALGGTGAGLLCVGIPMGIPPGIASGLKFELDKATGLIMCTNYTNQDHRIDVALFSSGQYSHLHIIGSNGDEASWDMNPDLSSKVIKGFFGRQKQ